ncbi:FMN-binding protein [PVC group bacterium]|nr:FMN-binding protein [PVC group bacterium]
MSEVELTISAKPNEPSSLRLVLTLGIAGMLSGLILVFVYQFTAPIIAANKARELRIGVLKVVPDSAVLEELTFVDGKLVENIDQNTPPSEIIYGAYTEDGVFKGFAIVGAGNGFQDTISLLYGYDPTTRLVTGMHILSSKETPGLGDKIFKDLDFVAQFEALAVDPIIESVKGGATSDNQIDAITGATISSNAVVKIINVAHEAWDEKTKGTPPAYTPPPPTSDELSEDGGTNE